MFRSKWRTFLLAGAVAFAGTACMASSADAFWGHRYGYSAYRPVITPVAPVQVYRPAYTYVPRYVAPVQRAYRPIVPVAPITVSPYQAGYGYYPSYGSYQAGYGSYGVTYGVTPVGYIGY